MKTDLYTKIIFTLIAIALWGILIKPIFVSENVRASNQVLDVNINEIGGRAVSDKILDVNIQKIKGQNFINTALPVKIRK
ncbi:MAG: hypothetical protein HW396_1599 [Candidatus Dadabacteria bacterium]|jgi:hypothetical protein|nr:hypothetical protein [Candidatus Dadabacteria bacterium]